MWLSVICRGGWGEKEQQAGFRTHNNELAEVQWLWEVAQAKPPAMAGWSCWSTITINKLVGGQEDSEDFDREVIQSMGKLQGIRQGRDKEAFGGEERNRHLLNLSEVQHP